MPKRGILIVEGGNFFKNMINGGLNDYGEGGLDNLYLNISIKLVLYVPTPIS